MQRTYEIYFTKKNIAKEEWNNLICTISKYNGLYHKWTLFLKPQKNQIRIFITAKCSLPATLNNLDGFLLKLSSNQEVSSVKAFPSRPYFNRVEANFFELFEFFETKKKGTIDSLEIQFKNVGFQKIISKTFLNVTRKDVPIRYHFMISLPITLLQLNFEANKRYFYKASPKYLDISKAMHLFKTDPAMAIFKVDTFPYLQGDFYLSQTSYNFNGHSLVLGASGSGKSKFLSSFVYNLSKNKTISLKNKVIVIDPHASLEKEMGELGKVIDFDSREDSINLFQNADTNFTSVTELQLELLKNLMLDQYNSKLERVLRHAIYLLLVSKAFHFQNLRKLLLDVEFRNNLIKEQKKNLPQSVINFFLTDFNDLRIKSYSEAIAPIIAFIDEMEMVPIFNDPNIEETLETVVNNNFLTLFSLNRTILGNKVTKMITSLIMQQLFLLVQKVSYQQHIILILDEVAVIENPCIALFLSESRKYNISVIIAGQYFNQISDNLKNAIFANTLNYYIFRISKVDALVLSENINFKIPLDDKKEAKVNLLSTLADRECVARISKNGVLLPGIKVRTLDFVSRPRKKIESQNAPTDISVPIEHKKFKIKSSIDVKSIMMQNSSSRKKDLYE